MTEDDKPDGPHRLRRPTRSADEYRVLLRAEMNRMRHEEAANNAARVASLRELLTVKPEPPDIVPLTRTWHRNARVLAPVCWGLILGALLPLVVLVPLLAGLAAMAMWVRHVGSTRGGIPAARARQRLGSSGP